MRRLNLILGILVSLALYGCTLDEPLQLSTRCGDKEHPLSMIVYNNVVCTPDNLTGENKNDICTQFLEAFKNNSCPIQSPLCIHENDDDDYVCSTSHCRVTHHEFDGQCEPNTVIHCGGHGVDCEARMPGWLSGSCLSDYTGGTCYATDCENGYNLTDGKCEAVVECDVGEHIYNGECEPDSTEDCGRHEFACAMRTAGWIDGTCEKGICVPNACDEGYSLKDGVCVANMACLEDEHIYKGTCEKSNVLNCGFHGNDCREVEGWSDGNCVESRCFASACAEGYDLNPETGACRLRPCEEGTEHQYGNVCEKNSVEHCGSHGNDCTQSVAGWAGGDCVHGSCEASACALGYRFESGAKTCAALINCGDNKHVSGETCADDSVTACGSENNDCTRRAGWKDGACVAADCVASDCMEGYEVKDGQCVSAIKTCAHCASNEVCVDGRCIVTGCTQDCNTYNHATSGVCGLNGVCIATACSSNYHLYNGTCELNSKDHCGKHGVACDATKHEVCNSAIGACECETGYEWYRYEDEDYYEIIECRVKGYTPLCDENNYTTVMYEGNEIRAWCIKSAEDLNSMWSVEGNEDNAYILMHDIDFGTLSHYGDRVFSGKFFGNGYKLTGKLDSYSGTALFPKLDGAYVNNLYLYLDASVLEGVGHSAALANFSDNGTVIENVHFKGSISGYGIVGGLVAEAKSTTFSHCSVEGDVSSTANYEGRGYDYAGGLIGKGEGGIVVNQCSVKGTVSGKTAGGIAGYSWWGSNFYQTTFEGEVTASENAGGIVGDVSYGPYFTQCSVKGKISGNEKVGGIAGASSYSIFRGNVFSGTVIGNKYVGGIVGDGNYQQIIDQCAVFGNIMGTSYSSESIGGFFGNGVARVNNSMCAADIQMGLSGALVGFVESSYNSVDVNNVYTIGKISDIRTGADVWADSGSVRTSGITANWFATSTRYLYDTITFEDNVAVIDGAEILGELNGNIESKLWSYRMCKIASGPAEGTEQTYQLPIPFMVPEIDFCTRNWE